MGELSASYARLLTTDFEADYFGPTRSIRGSLLW
jgi:hypothetical protein